MTGHEQPLDREQQYWSTEMNENLAAKFAEFVSSISREVPAHLLPEISQLNLEEMVLKLIIIFLSYVKRCQVWGII